MTEDTVQVYVYDLSQGLARVYSPMLLGILIDAIYHTLGGYPKQRVPPRPRN